MTPSQPSDAPDARVLLTEATGQPHGAAATETYLTMARLRERGWTDAMIREHLGGARRQRPNPGYRSAAPMKLYLAERAEAAEASLEWVERKTRGAWRLKGPVLVTCYTSSKFSCCLVLIGAETVTSVRLRT